MNGVGALIGLAFGCGGYVIVTDPDPWRGRVFTRRVNGYLHGESRVRGLSRLIGEMRLRGIAERQRRAGFPVDPSAHLLACVTASMLGLVVATATIATLMVARGVHNPAAAAPLLALFATSGWLLAERRLDERGRARQRRAAIELPAVAESLALAVHAGAAVPHAIDVVSRREVGVLMTEMRGVVSDISRGQSLDEALAAMCQRMPIPSVVRFIDALRIALERGTPVADVLHAQASDARHESRRLLMESAGKREVAMLIPVVFLVLPAVVVIALFPGFRELTSMV